jgi:glutamate dehydrogenase (NADP+)
MGGKVITMSDSNGYFTIKDGIDAKKLAWIMEIEKHKDAGELKSMLRFSVANTLQAKTPWGVKCDVCFAVRYTK